MIRFVVDSTATPTKEFAEKHRLTIVPLRVLFGEEVYKDQVDMTPSEFFEKLARSEQLPTTSQPPVSDFEEAYRKILDEGDEIIALTISSKLSGTYLSAMGAKGLFPEDAPISVIDSYSTSVGMIKLLEVGFKAIEEGKSREEVVQEIEAAIPRVRVYFLVDTLEYLRKGGRIGGAAKFLGTLLNIKPLLQLKDGVVESLEKARSRKKGLRRLVELAREDLGDDVATASIGIVHGNVPQDAEAFAAQIQESLGCEKPVIMEVSPVLGVHTGPGVIGLGYLVPEG
jgi:DegV family protein with EDD domain